MKFRAFFAAVTLTLTRRSLYTNLTRIGRCTRRTKLNYILHWKLSYYIHADRHTYFASGENASHRPSSVTE